MIESVIGFNPCCHGLAIAAAYGVGMLTQLNEFQSLLSWISHCGQAVADQGLL